jgi:hypothetical protein
MKNKLISMGLGLLSLGVLSTVQAVPTVDVPVTWDSGLDGWNQAGGATLSNPGGYLQAQLPISGVPANYQIYADGTTAGGIYAGNQTYSEGYLAVFDFKYDNAAPSGLSLYFMSGSGNEWIRPISGSLPSLGNWGTYTVAFDYGAGAWDLALGGGDYATFLTDLMDVDRVGFWVGVGSQPFLQNVGFDNFELRIPEPNTVFFLSAVLLSLGASFRRNVADGLRWARGLVVKA